jgi:hydrogenase expression/formation protein HypE
VVIAPKEQAPALAEALRGCPNSGGATIIGEVTDDRPGWVVMRTEIGAETLLPQPGGELLPRIC